MALWDEIWKSPYAKEPLNHAPQHDKQAIENFKHIKASLQGRDAGDLDDNSICLIRDIMCSMRMRDADVKNGQDPEVDWSCGTN